MPTQPGDLPIDSSIVGGTELAQRLNRILPDVVANSAAIEFHKTDPNPHPQYSASDKVSKAGDTMTGRLRITPVEGQAIGIGCSNNAQTWVATYMHHPGNNVAWTQGIFQGSANYVFGTVGADGSNLQSKVWFTPEGHVYGTQLVAGGIDTVTSGSINLNKTIRNNGGRSYWGDFIQFGEWGGTDKSMGIDFHATGFAPAATIFGRHIGNQWVGLQIDTAQLAGFIFNASGFNCPGSVFVNRAQANEPNSLARKDYVDAVAGAGGAKAWVNFVGSGVVGIRAAYNVSSITDAAVGNYVVNLTNGLADEHYAMVGTAEQFVNQGYIVGHYNGQQRTNSSCAILCRNNANTAGDPAFIELAFFR